ncbi:MAG: MATE family efflux transporter [Chloroflexi bacterium]|nr:MATE family efflux transporter [Chloroflexota bacterium]
MLELVRDKSFTTTLLHLAIPIALQQLIFSSLNLVTVTMVGQLGETSVAAVGLANQILFLFQLLLFGLTSGSAIFVAQFWGKRDVANIRRVLGTCLGMGLLAAVGFTLVAVLAPEQALAIYTNDQAVIALGSEYLRITGLIYIPLAITTSYAVTLRSTGNVRMPVTITVFALGLGAALNYALIFGQFGLPALGVQGSAIGLATARLVECAVLLFLTYSTGTPAAARLRELIFADRAFLRQVLTTSVPVMVNEILWSVGISAYSLVYGRIGTEAIAAVSIAMTIEGLAFVPFIGLANAAAIMIGHRIGADEEHKAFGYAKGFLLLVIVSGMLIGGMVFLTADFALGLYKIGAGSHQIARNVLTIMALVLWVKVSNMMLIVGVLRAGGDTRVGFVIDVGPLWLVGLPLMVTGAFVLGLPAYWVYALAMSDEVAKLVVALLRVFSRRWINNLARQHAPVGVGD